MSTFQYILIGIFIIALVAAVAIFSGFIKVGGGSKDPVEIKISLTIWGTLRSDLVAPAIQNFKETNYNITLSYVEKNPKTLKRDLVEALANGFGPDLFLLSDAEFYAIKDRLYVITPQDYPTANFRSVFISQSENLIAPAGVYGLPLIVDPLIMYYNRTIFDDASIAIPPVYWEDLLTISSSLTKKSDPTKITRSAVALGTYGNVNNAKEILFTLLMQAGNPVFVATPTGLTPVLSSADGGGPLSPTESVLRYFTQFSNPSQDAYSWTRAMPQSKDAFLSGDLAIYFGFASELFELSRKNPNLTFDIAKIPQTRDGKTQLTFGHLYSFSISKKSQKVADALTVAQMLTDAAALNFATSSSLPPARRNLVAAAPPSPYYLKIFYQSALVSRAPLDPDVEKTSAVFGDLIENILSNRYTVSQSLKTANDQLKNILGLR